MLLGNVLVAASVSDLGLLSTWQWENAVANLSFYRRMHEAVDILSSVLLFLPPNRPQLWQHLHLCVWRFTRVSVRQFQKTVSRAVVLNPGGSHPWSTKGSWKPEHTRGDSTGCCPYVARARFQCHLHCPAWVSSVTQRGLARGIFWWWRSAVN